MKAIFVSPDGSVDELEVEPGTSLMLAATSNGLTDIVGDCGGSASCATCHVYVEPEFVAHLPPMSNSENQMLDATAAPREPNSRLSCQILMRESLDGIRVRVADPQL
jgi:2Fe-2S ferredoxin